MATSQLPSDVVALLPRPRPSRELSVTPAIHEQPVYYFRCLSRLAPRVQATSTILNARSNKCGDDTDVYLECSVTRVWTLFPVCVYM